MYICKTCQKEMFSVTESVEVFGEIYCKRCDPDASGQTSPKAKSATLQSDPIKAKEPTKMSSVDNRISRSWPATIVSLMIAAGLAFGAIALLNSDHGILAAIVGLFALSAALMATQWRKTNCPHCGASITSPGGIRLCGSCGQYSQPNRDRMVPVGPGTVAEKPFFEVKIARLLNSGQMPADWKWPRPHLCCVCAAPATRNYNADLNNLDERYASIKETRVRIAIPHCDKHKDGIAYDDALGMLRFSSFDCWREFCALNLGGGSER